MCVCLSYHINMSKGLFTRHVLARLRPKPQALPSHGEQVL